MIHLCTVKTGKGKWVITSSDCVEKHLRTIEDEITAREVFRPGLVIPVEDVRDMEKVYEYELQKMWEIG